MGPGRCHPAQRPATRSHPARRPQTRSLCCQRPLRPKLRVIVIQVGHSLESSGPASTRIPRRKLEGCRSGGRFVCRRRRRRRRRRPVPPFLRARCGRHLLHRLDVQDQRAPQGDGGMGGGEGRAGPPACAGSESPDSPPPPPSIESAVRLTHRKSCPPPSPPRTQPAMARPLVPAPVLRACEPLAPGRRNIESRGYLLDRAYLRVMTRISEDVTRICPSRDSEITRGGRGISES